MWRKLVQSIYRRKVRFYRYLEEDMVGVTLPRQQQWEMFMGGLTILWAQIERLLDMWIEEIHVAGGATDVQAHLPSNLDRELDYLTEAIKRGFVDSAKEFEARRLIAELHRVKKFRHDLIHGTTRVESGRVICESWRVRGSRRMEFKTTYTVAQQWRHYDQTKKLLSDIRTFLLSIYGEEASS